MRYLFCAACAVLTLAGQNAHADFDLSYTTTSTKSFSADQEIDFDHLVPGAILTPGDPISPGVSFGGVGEGAEQRALVIDTGGGDLALQQINLGTEMDPDQSRIVFAFDADVRSVGADLNALGSFESNPNSYNYDATLDALGFISVGGDVIGFLGWIGTEESRPTRFLEYQYVGVQPATPLAVDDLAILYVPEPAPACAQLAVLCGLSALARRRGYR